MRSDTAIPQLIMVIFSKEADLLRRDISHEN